MKNIIVFLVILLFSIVMMSCGIDSNPLESAPEEVITAQLVIHSPSFVRTNDTKDLWLDETEVDLIIPIETAPSSDGGDHHGKLSASLSPMIDTLFNGMGIELEIFSGMPVLKYELGQWYPTFPKEHDINFQVILEDKHEAEVHTDTLYARIFNCEVEFVIEKDGLVIAETHLDPIFGHHGFYYGENFTLPDTGNYDITVSVSPPTFARDEHTATKWMESYAETFTYYFDGQTLLNEVFIGESESVEGLTLEIEANIPETLWHMESEGILEEHAPDSSVTHHFSVKIEDSHTIVHERRIGYSKVSVNIMSNVNGHLTDFECSSVFGEQGFHYGKNIEIPEVSTDATVVEDDGHDDH